MNSKQLVKNAIAGAGVDRIPVYLFNKDLEQSDIVSYCVETAESFHGDDPNRSEWGFLWERLDDTMGQPKEPVIKDWADLKNYRPPDGRDRSRLRSLPAFLEKYRDKYIVAGFGITGFGILTFLRGFENTLEDLYLERENLETLADMVFGYEEDVIRRLVETDIDAVAFYDDWGMQFSLMISPALWRDFFKPRYKRQFDIVHAAGKHVYFHSCGYVFDILEDLVEIGADIFNFNQPEVMGLEKLAKFRGRVCFNCPVDLQKVAINADRAAIEAYTRRLVETLGTGSGGFIGYVEEYRSIGLSDENYGYMVDALRNYRP